MWFQQINHSTQKSQPNWAGGPCCAIPATTWSQLPFWLLPCLTRRSTGGRLVLCCCSIWATLLSWSKSHFAPKNHSQMIATGSIRRSKPKCRNWAAVVKRTKKKMSKWIPPRMAMSPPVWCNQVLTAAPYQSSSPVDASFSRFPLLCLIQLGNDHLGEPKRVTVSTQGPNGETVATVDEVAALKYSTTSQKGPDEMAAIGMRMMISNSFAPKTRLRMASRLLIMEVSIVPIFEITFFYWLLRFTHLYPSIYTILFLSLSRTIFKRTLLMGNR